MCAYVCTHVKVNFVFVAYLVHYLVVYFNREKERERERDREGEREARYAFKAQNASGTSEDRSAVSDRNCRYHCSQRVTVCLKSL